MTRNIPGRFDSEELLDALHALVDEGCVDAGRGGVSSAALAEELGWSLNAVRSHLQTLREADRVARVQGFDAENHEPRPSYLPMDHPHAPTDDSVDTTRRRRWLR